MKNNLFTSLLTASLLIGMTGCASMKASSSTNNVNLSTTKNLVPVVKETEPIFTKKNTKKNVSSSVSHPITLKTSDTKSTITGNTAVNHANQASIKKPTSGNYVNAIMYFDYQPGLLYQIYCAPLHITDIELQSGEKIISASGGDTNRWSISETESGGASGQQTPHLLIKPRESNINNVVVVTTNQRTYHLLFKSSNTTYMPIVAWRYPNDGLIINHPSSSTTADNTETSVNQLNKLDFNYTVQLVTGGQLPDWMPIMIFNDGKKTYIRFSKLSTNSPTLFVDNGGNPRVVNYRVAGDYYIVDAVIRQGELRMGQLKKQTIVNITYKGSA
jgi:type IV secretion system protein VirB9